MNPILKNVLAVLAGLLVAGIVNMAIVTLSSSVVPLPAGVDPNDIESIKANINNYKPINFLMPFLAHAVGTLAGAFLTAKLAATNHLRLALVIGVFFIVGGISINMMLGGPIWFSILDIVVAYIPMAYLGYILSGKKDIYTSV